MPRVERVIHAWRQAWRSVLSAKAPALLAATALAVGIGSATAIYSVVNAVMLKPLPYRDGERFVAMFAADTRDPARSPRLRSDDARIFEERTRAFDAFGWFREAGKNLTFAGEPHHVHGVMVTVPLVEHLGVQPIVGHWFRDLNGAVISSALWQRLGNDPAIIGQALTLDGRIYTVTGVMPEAFHLPVAGVTSAGLRADVWMPLDPREQAGAAYVAYARLRPDVSFQAAEADVKRVAADIAAEDPRTSSRVHGSPVRSSRDRHPEHPADAAAALRRGRTVVPDHVCQRRRAAAGAVGRAGARNRHARGARSQPGATRGALSRGRRADLAGRRCRRRVAGADDHAGDRVTGRELSAQGGRGRGGLDRSAVRAGRRRRGERAVEPRAASAGRPDRADRGPDRRRAGLGRPPEPARHRRRSSLPRSRWPFRCWRSAPCCSRT